MKAKNSAARDVQLELQFRRKYGFPASNISCGQQHPKGQQNTTEFQSGRQQRPPPARRRLALAALTVANASNFWQRNLIYALASVIPPQCLKECENAAFVPVCDVCENDECGECQTCRAGADAAYYSIRDAACVSDRQYGLLASVAFTTCFALSGLAAGHLADRLDAKRLHAGAALTWALAGFLPVIYPSFSMLVLARFITGVAEGFNAPCAYPVTAYHYAVHERASANGCYSMGTYAGSALSTLSLLFAMGVGWRQTTTMACVVGIFAAALLWLVVDRPPRRTIPSDSLYVSLRRAVLYVLRVKRLLGLYGATSVRMAATVSLWTYLPTYYSRAFPEDAVAFSLSYALGTLLCGAASSSGGGYIADAWAVRRKGAHGDVAAIGAVLAVPLAYGCLYAATFGGSLTCLLLLILVSECWLGPGMSLLVEDVPTKSMGTQVALLLVCNQAVAALGPWAVSTHDPGDAKVRDPLFLCVCICLVTSAVAFSLVGRAHGIEDEDRAQHEVRALLAPPSLARGRRTPPLGGDLLIT